MTTDETKPLDALEVIVRQLGDGDNHDPDACLVCRAVDVVRAELNRRAQPAAPADAAPSVVPEPVAWEELAWSLFTHIRHGDDGHKAWLHRELRTWFALNYPPRAPLTEEFWLMLDTALDALKYHQEQTRPIELTRVTIAAVETFISAHGIGGK